MFHKHSTQVLGLVGQGVVQSNRSQPEISRIPALRQYFHSTLGVHQMEDVNTGLYGVEPKCEPAEESQGFVFSVRHCGV
jgi:hypothetical protein